MRHVVGGVGVGQEVGTEAAVGGVGVDLEAVMAPILHAGVIGQH